MRKSSILLTTVLVLAACGKTEAPAPTPALPTAEVVSGQPAQEPAPASATTVFWQQNFDSVEGWFDMNDDKSYASLLTGESGGKAKLTEAGPDEWGKSAILIKDLDMSRAPMLEATVVAIDGGKWGVGIVPDPWNDADYKELLPWQEASGTKTVDLAAATGWSGMKNVNLVILVANEGKSVTFDDVKIQYTK